MPAMFLGALKLAYAQVLARQRELEGAGEEEAEEGREEALRAFSALAAKIAATYAGFSLSRPAIVEVRPRGAGVLEGPAAGGRWPGWPSGRALLLLLLTSRHNLPPVRPCADRAWRRAVRTEHPRAPPLPGVGPAGGGAPSLG
jgi:hypothetical protein